MFEYACDLEIAQNSSCLVSRDHMFFPEMAHIWTQVELSQDLRAEKVSHLREKTRDHEKLDSLNFELSQDQMHIQTCDIGSFDDFLSYLRVRPVFKTFWPSILRCLGRPLSYFDPILVKWPSTSTHMDLDTNLCPKSCPYPSTSVAASVFGYPSLVKVVKITVTHNL